MNHQNESALELAQKQRRAEQREKLRNLKFEYVVDGGELKHVYDYTKPNRRGKYFGAKDVDAALMTWAVQVDPNEETELLALRARIVFEREGVYSLTEEDLPEYSDYEGELPALCVLIQRVMKTLHGAGGVIKTDLQRVAAWRTAIQSDPQSPTWAFPDKEGEMLIPLRDLLGVYLPPGDDIAALLFVRFDAFISQVISGEASIAACPQCDGLYQVSVKRREQQIFCSPRCRHRAVVKKHYISDREKNKNVVK